MASDYLLGFPVMSALPPSLTKSGRPPEASLKSCSSSSTVTGFSPLNGKVFYLIIKICWTPMIRFLVWSLVWSRV